jgi:hypothetical protein
MKILTTIFFEKFNPCYPPEKALGENWSGTILDLLDMESIPAKDRIWAATRPGVLSDKVLRLAAVAFVRETPLGDGRKVFDLLTDERSIKALEVAELYAHGEASKQELRRASYAARAAAYAYAYAAARDASADAYAYAASASADASADAASYASCAASSASCAASAFYAASASAFYAASAQVGILKNIIKQSDNGQ